MNWISFYLNTKQLGGGSSSSSLRPNGESFFVGMEKGPGSLKYLVVLSLNDGYMECEELKLGSQPLCVRMSQLSCNTSLILPFGSLLDTPTWEEIS